MENDSLGYNDLLNEEMIEDVVAFRDALKEVIEDEHEKAKGISQKEYIDKIIKGEFKKEPFELVHKALGKLI